MLVISVITLVAFLGRLTYHLLPTVWQATDKREPLPPKFLDDTSHMNATQVAEVSAVPSGLDETEKQLAQLLRFARKDNLQVSIAGARHKMRGHTMFSGGIMINILPFGDIQLDDQNDILHM